MIAQLWAATATLAAPVLRVLLSRRARRGKEIAARLGERFGQDPTPRPSGRILWLHAASVGESVSILPVLTALTQQAADMHVLLTTGTVTSAALLGQRLPELGLHPRVTHRFAPLDVPEWVASFLDHWKPGAAGFVESEIWPNQIQACRKHGIPMMLINARMSERSFRAWKRLPGFAAQTLAGFVTIRARGAQDAERLRQLGARSVECPGDLKLAAPPLPASETGLSALRAIIGDRPVWVAASTHPGEESLIAAVHAALTLAHPGLLTIVVPRHPERGPAIAAALGAHCRSDGAPPPDGGIWVADTLGELGLWYRLARIVFVGRSLLPPGGGQNPMEPARLGCAVLTGPHTGNFAEHRALLQDAGALIEVRDSAALTEAISALLHAPDQVARMGKRAAMVTRRQEDLPAETAAALIALLPPA